jgi:hypothetical protein
MVTNCGARKCFFRLILQLPSYTNCLIHNGKPVRVGSATLKITAGKENSRFNNVTDCLKIYYWKFLMPRSTHQRRARPHAAALPARIRFTVNWTSTCQSIRERRQTCCALRCRTAMLTVLSYSCASPAPARPLATVFRGPPTAPRSIPCRKKYSSRPSVAK